MPADSAESRDGSTPSVGVADSARPTEPADAGGQDLGAAYGTTRLEGDELAPPSDAGKAFPPALLALLDSDSDGRSDLDELMTGSDPNDPTDGPDIDGDGTANDEDEDVDGDGTANAVDRDVDGDGVPNEKDDDIDGDGLDNDEDDDDDGDGVPDLLDGDDDADGEPDDEDDDDEDDDDGTEDVLDGGVREGGVTSAPTDPCSGLSERAQKRDTDGDGLPDCKDRDADGDGKLDTVDTTETDAGPGMAGSTSTSP